MFGPYESAVSMKFTPRSGSLLNVRNASARSAGGPHIPGPVSRIVPKPSRLTRRSSPILKVPDLAAEFVSDIETLLNQNRFRDKKLRGARMFLQYLIAIANRHIFRQTGSLIHLENT